MDTVNNIFTYILSEVDKLASCCVLHKKLDVYSYSGRLIHSEDTSAQIIQKRVSSSASQHFATNIYLPIPYTIGVLLQNQLVIQHEGYLVAMAIIFG